MRNCPAVPGQVKQVLSQFTERISVTRLSNFHFRESTVSVSLRHWLHRESDGTEVAMKRGMVASTVDYLRNRQRFADRRSVHGGLSRAVTPCYPELPETRRSGGGGVTRSDGE